MFTNEGRIFPHLWVSDVLHEVTMKGRFASQWPTVGDVIHSYNEHTPMLQTCNPRYVWCYTVNTKDKSLFFIYF